MHAEKLEARSLANQFRPLMAVLTTLGPYRMKLRNFSETQDTKVPVVVTKFSLRDVIAPYPYLLLLWYTFGSLIWAFNVELDLPFPFRL